MSQNTQLNNYVRAMVPEKYTILGVPLKPFCLGHYLLMQRFDVKFASDDPNCMGSVIDLLLGITICSRSYNQFLDFINSKSNFETYMHQWSNHIESQIKNDPMFNIISKISMFQDYMKSGIDVPKIIYENDNGNDKQSGAHWSQSLLIILVSELKYTEEQALNMPLSKSLYDYYKWMENQGAITYMTDDEIEMDEKLKEQPKEKDNV